MPAAQERKNSLLFKPLTVHIWHSQAMTPSSGATVAFTDCTAVTLQRLHCSGLPPPIRHFENVAWASYQGGCGILSANDECSYLLMNEIMMLQANGLLTSNSWAGYHVLLNPEYSGSTQWRFVNRAIDEVENDRVCPFHALHCLTVSLRLAQARQHHGICQCIDQSLHHV